MRVLVAVGERGGDELIAELDALLPLRGHEAVLVHVIDTGVRGEMGLLRGRHHPPRPLPRHRAIAIGDAERSVAARALAEARAAAERRGAAVVDGVVGEGEPGRLVAALAADHRCALVAIAVRDDDRRDVPPGPKSLGHTARFVLDHSPCPVLLVRHGPPPPVPG